MTAECLLPALGTRGDATIRLLVGVGVDPQDLNGFIKRVGEVDPARCALPLAARAAGTQMKFERLRRCRAFLRCDRCAAREIEHQRRVDAIDAHRHASIFNRDALHGNPIGGPLSVGRRDMIEQRDFGRRAFLRRIDKPPTPRAIAAGLAIPKSRAVDPHARANGIVVEPRLRVDTRARGGDPLAHRVEIDVARHRRKCEKERRYHKRKLHRCSVSALLGEASVEDPTHGGAIEFSPAIVPHVAVDARELAFHRTLNLGVGGAVLGG